MSLLCSQRAILYFYNENKNARVTMPLGSDLLHVPRS